MYWKVIAGIYLEGFNLNYCQVTWVHLRCPCIGATWETNLSRSWLKMCICSLCLLHRQASILKKKRIGHKQRKPNAWRTPNYCICGDKLVGYRWGLDFEDIQPTTEDSPQTQGLLDSLIAKIINNVQVTVKNIHIRYEDNMSVPGVCWHLLALLGRTLFHIEYSTLLLLASLSLGSLQCQSTMTGRLHS